MAPTRRIATPTRPTSPPSKEKRHVQAISFYLPQFHPVPLNDRAWGKNFTEWSSTLRGAPLFPRHYQPHLPSELGTYDLRIADVRAQQTAMAKEAGLSAFSLYHYWHSGARAMHEVIDAFFDEEHPVHMMLCWANHSWTRQWTGDRTVLIEQEYSADDDDRHSSFLVGLFQRPSYFRVNERPVFLVYDPATLRGSSELIPLLREKSELLGLSPLIGACVNFDEPVDFDDWGYDFELRWSPNFMWIFGTEHPLIDRYLRLNSRTIGRKVTRHRWNRAFDHPRFSQAYFRRPKPNWPTTECVFPSWDNTARRTRGEAFVFVGSDPDLFERSLTEAVDRVRPEDPPLVFINAWNEWAEGCHLEPCDRWGRAWIEACARVFA